MSAPATTLDSLPDDVNDTVDALVQAEAFIAGFDGDPSREGVSDVLAGLRAAIQREVHKPCLLSALRALRNECSGTPRPTVLAFLLANADVAISKAELQVSSNRPGDQAAIYAAETGVDYATALVHCNMD
ncbi:hypothetical protein MAUB1S_11418 [Mycolicibacterium aubagnense]